MCRSTYWKPDDDVGMAGLGGDADSHPYVSFTINIAWFKCSCNCCSIPKLMHYLAPTIRMDWIPVSVSLTQFFCFYHVGFQGPVLFKLRSEISGPILFPWKSNSWDLHEFLSYMGQWNERVLARIVWCEADIFGLWDWNSHHILIDCYWALKLCHVFHLQK